MRSLLLIAALSAFSCIQARIITDRIQANPLTGEVEVREVKNSIEDGPFGGDGGSAWTDGGEIHTYGPITAIEVRHGWRVDSLMFRYRQIFVSVFTCVWMCVCLPNPFHISYVK